MGDDADGHELLAVVAALHHQATCGVTFSPVETSVSERWIAPVHQSFDDGHLGLLELLLGVTASSMGKIDGMADLNVVGQRDILHIYTNPCISLVIHRVYEQSCSLLGVPLPEELDFLAKLRDVLGERCGGCHFDFWAWES